MIVLTKKKVLFFFVAVSNILKINSCLLATTIRPSLKPTRLVCTVQLAQNKPKHLAFMSIFHATWMSNIAANLSNVTEKTEDAIYITKSFKGIVIRNVEFKTLKSCI